MAVTPDGIAISNRLDTTTERKLHAKVVDNVLNSRTFAARLMSMGESFVGKTYDYTIKISNSGLGQWFTGVETLSTAATDTTITLSYAHTAFAQPVVIPMLEAFANQGSVQTIDLALFKIEEAVAEAIQTVGTSIYSTGSANQPDGLGAIVDDGTDVTTIGGQSRTTYTNLKATRTAASGGVLSLSNLATLHDNCSAAGYESEEPTIHVTTKTVWSLYEQLLQPSVRASYEAVGFDALPIRGDSIVKKADLKGGQGFTVLTYRGVPVIKDDACTAGNWFMLNERYLKWKGRDIVPDQFRGFLEKVNLGAKTMEGVGAQPDYMKPSEHNGWFYQKLQILPNQAGAVGRYYVIGQAVTNQPRRNGRLTGLTTV